LLESGQNGDLGVDRRADVRLAGAPPGAGLRRTTLERTRRNTSEEAPSPARRFHAHRAHDRRRHHEESYFAEYGAYVSALPSPATIANNQKTNFDNSANGSGKGFDRVGWSPEGQVYFNYSVNTNLGTDDQFTVAGHADIDNDADPQYWGYAKGTQNGKTHTGLGTCQRADLTAETVMPCTTDSGQSVF
jgi:hypothetical protein